MMKMPPSVNHTFANVPAADIPRSKFDRSFTAKTTFNSGYLVPILVEEALPGDTFNVNMNAFARLSTPLHPFMDNLYFETFFFFVPERLIWNNWEKFNGAQDNPGDSTSFLTPIADVTKAPLSTTGYLNGSLQDYMGLPTQVPGFTHRQAWLRAYNLIWNQWFRDENLQNSLTVDKGDGPDDPANYVLKRRNKRHDYFTSALPWPQKGTAVSIPLGSSAPVKMLTAGGTSGAITLANTTTGAGGQLYQSGGTIGNNAIFTDLTTASAATINQLRQSFQIQKLYERDARGGTRYTEIILSHFGVRSDDARLQRAEYLGGGSTPIVINPIAQTSASNTQPTPQGNLAAMGTVTVSRGHGFSKSFTEHGVILGLLNVRADMTYQQGLHRKWSRRTRFDFYWPALSHIGEQSVLSQEIYCAGSADPTGDASVFGYQERYAEYRYAPGQITGQYRSNFAQTLDSWHLAQNFASRPILGDTFMQENPPVSRVVAVPSYPEFLADFYFHMICARPMPVYSVPEFIDHF